MGVSGKPVRNHGDDKITLISTLFGPGTALVLALRLVLRIGVLSVFDPSGVFFPAQCLVPPSTWLSKQKPWPSPSLPSLSDLRLQPSSPLITTLKSHSS